VVKLYGWQTYLASFVHLPNDRIELTFLNSNAPGHNIVNFSPTINIEYGTCPSLPPPRSPLVPSAPFVPPVAGTEIIPVTPLPITINLSFVRKYDTTKRVIITPTNVITPIRQVAYTSFSVSPEIIIVSVNSNVEYLIISEGPINDRFNKKFLYDFTAGIGYINVEYLFYKRSFHTSTSDFGWGYPVMNLLYMYTSATRGIVSQLCFENLMSISHGDDTAPEQYKYLMTPPFYAVGPGGPNGDEILQEYPGQLDYFDYSIEMRTINGPINITRSGDTRDVNDFLDYEYFCQFNSGLDDYNLIIGSNGFRGGLDFNHDDIVIKTVNNVKSVEEAASICFNEDHAVGFVYENETVKLFDMRINYKPVRRVGNPPSGIATAGIRTEANTRDYSSATIFNHRKIESQNLIRPLLTFLNSSSTYSNIYLENVQTFDAPYNVNKVCMFMCNVPMNTRFVIGTINPRTLLMNRFTGVSKTRLYPMEISISFQNPLQTMSLKVYIDPDSNTCKIQNISTNQYLIPTGSVTDVNNPSTNWFFKLPYYSADNVIQYPKYPGTDYDCVFMNTADPTKIMYGTTLQVTKDYDIKYRYRNLVLYNDSKCEFYESNVYNEEVLFFPRLPRHYEHEYFHRGVNVMSLDCIKNSRRSPNEQINFTSLNGSIVRLDHMGITDIDAITVTQPSLQVRFFYYRVGDIPPPSSGPFDFVNHTSNFIVRGSITGLMSGAYNFNQRFVRKNEGDRRVGRMTCGYRLERYPPTWPDWSIIDKTVCVLTNQNRSKSVNLKPLEYWEPGLWGSGLGDKEAFTLTLDAGFRADIFDNYGYNGNTFTFWGPAVVTNIELATGGMVKNNSLSSIRIEPIVIHSSIPRPVARLYPNANKTGNSTDIYSNDIHRIFNTDSRLVSGNIMNEYTWSGTAFRSFDILDAENFSGTMQSNRFILTKNTGVDNYVRFALEENKIKIVSSTQNQVSTVFSIFAIKRDMVLVDYNSFIVLHRNGAKDTSLTGRSIANPIYTEPDIVTVRPSAAKLAEYFFWTTGIYILMGVGFLAGLGALRSIKVRPIPLGGRKDTPRIERGPYTGTPDRTPRPSITLQDGAQTNTIGTKTDPEPEEDTPGSGNVSIDGSLQKPIGGSGDDGGSPGITGTGSNGHFFGPRRPVPGWDLDGDPAPAGSAPVQPPRPNPQPGSPPISQEVIRSIGAKQTGYDGTRYPDVFKDGQPAQIGTHAGNSYFLGAQASGSQA